MTSFSETDLRRKIDMKTKPTGALGTLEALAFQIASVQRNTSPILKQPTMLVFAADHGVAESGVSAYPQEVTFQMVLNFLQGGAAINVFCKQHQFRMQIIDAGVKFDFEAHPLLASAKGGYGTKNFIREPAMLPQQVDFCLNQGAAIAAQHLQQGCNVMGFGEMGIANTSAAAMLMTTLTGIPLVDCVGRGTGLDDKGLQNKLNLLGQAQKRVSKSLTAREALGEFGGFEIAQMAGAMIEAAHSGAILLIDGFIATSAFLVAVAMNPEIRPNAVFCHQSDESGHARMLEYLDAKPLLKLGLRLGEGTGAALAYPLLVSAVSFLRDMASFESAGVSDKEA